MNTFLFILFHNHKHNEKFTFSNVTWSSTAIQQYIIMTDFLSETNVQLLSYSSFLGHSLLYPHYKNRL